MVYRRKMVSRSQFRKLPFGAAFWDADTVNVAPSIKVGRAATAGAFVTDHITQTAWVATDAAVVRVPQVFLKPVV